MNQDQSEPPALNVTAEDTVSVHTRFRLASAEKHGKHRAWENGAKEELCLDNGRWVTVARLFDRVNDHYRETITDMETGKVILVKDEPLSMHRGYGSAKRQSQGKARRCEPSP